LSRQQSGSIGAVLLGAIVVVTILWTIITGNIWHWPAVVCAIAVSLAVIKAANGPRGPKGT